MNQNNHQRTILETILARHDVVICYNGVPEPLSDEENFVQITNSMYRTRKKKSLAEIDCLVRRIRDTYTQSMLENTKIELIYADNDRLETILVLPK